jgi:hypothetical protein
VNAIRGSVTGNGGLSAPPGTNGPQRLYGTVGQSAVGLGSSPNFILCHGFWCFGGARVVAVEPGAPGTPRELAFGLPTPTPSRGDTRFTLALPKAAEVKLTVYDVGGRAVGDPAVQHLDAGYHELYWRAQDGRPGVYFARLQVDGEVKGERRIVLVR